MNIEQILINSKGKILNDFTASRILEASKSLPKYLIGKNSGLIVDDLEDISQRISKCSTGAIVARKGDESKVLQLHQCSKKAFCPNCADSEEGKKLRKFNDMLSQNWDNINYAYMVTFTIKNGVSLDERVEKLRNSWRKFQMMGKKGRTGEFSKFNGFFKSIEIKKELGKKGKVSKFWHPHQHVIVFTSEPLDFEMYDRDIVRDIKRDNNDETLLGADFKIEVMQRGGCKKLELLPDGTIIPVSKIQSEWIKSTGYDGINIDVSPIFTKWEKPKKFTSLYELGGTSENKVLAEIKYAMKYSIKPEDIIDMNYRELFDLLDIMRSVRLSEVGGFLRKSPKSRSEGTVQDREIDKYFEGKEKLEDLQDFLWKSEIKDYSLWKEGYFEDHKSEKSNLIYRYCLDIQREYQKGSIYEIIDYSSIRKQLFDIYRAGSIKPYEYCAHIKKAKFALRKSLHKLRHERDMRINERTGGKLRRIDRLKRYLPTDIEDIDITIYVED